MDISNLVLHPRHFASLFHSQHNLSLTHLLQSTYQHWCTYIYPSNQPNKNRISTRNTRRNPLPRRCPLPRNRLPSMIPPQRKPLALAKT